MKAFTNRSEAAAAGLNLTLEQSVEGLTYAGLQKKLYELFELRCGWKVSDSERAHVIQKLMGNPGASPDQPLAVRYPYGLLTLQSWSEDQERGNVRAMSKRGFPFSIDQTSRRALYAKVLPVVMRVELEYVTNDLKELNRFLAAWIHARRGGWLSFNIQYGRTSFSVTVRADGDLTIPQRTGDLDTIKEYSFIAPLEMRSFVSLPTLVEQQVVTDLSLEGNVTDDVNNPNAVSTATFWSFNPSPPANEVGREAQTILPD